MIFHMSPGLAEARLVATLNYLDSGPGNASVELYQGTMPTPPGSSAAGSILLVAVPLVKPMGVVSTGGPLTVALSALALILSSGQADWARWYNGHGVWAGDSDVSVDGFDGFVQLADTTLFAGGKTQILGGTIE